MAAVPVSAAKMAAVHTAGGSGTPPLPADATSADSPVVDTIVPHQVSPASVSSERNLSKHFTWTLGKGILAKTLKWESFETMHSAPDTMAQSTKNKVMPHPIVSASARN